MHKSCVCLCPLRLPVGFYSYGGQRKSPGRLPPWLAKLLSKETEEPEMSGQIENTVDDDIESDLESCLSDEDEAPEESSTELVDESSSKSPPTTSKCCSLRSRAGGVQLPKCYM